jgi:hypothetical protein
LSLRKRDFGSAWILFISCGPRPRPFSSSTPQEHLFMCMWVSEREREEWRRERGMEERESEARE